MSDYHLVYSFSSWELFGYLSTRCYEFKNPVKQNFVACIRESYRGSLQNLRWILGLSEAQFRNCYCCLMVLMALIPTFQSVILTPLWPSSLGVLPR
jgi:hypothetical protein